MLLLRFLALVFTLALLAAGTARPADAQPVKYWILLADKQPEAGHSLAAIAPSARAEARRRLRGSPRRPAHLDAPVSEPYLQRLRDAGIEPVVTSRWLNAVSAYLDESQTAAVRRLPFVRGIRPVGRLVPQRAPAAPASPVVLPDYGPSRRQLELINAHAPIEAGYTGAGVVIGFLDTTYDFEHPALLPILSGGRLLGEMDFTGQPQSNTHGLSVASVAVGFDEGELVGPGHGASVLAATTEYAPTETRQEEDFFVAGMEWLEAEGADVVNVSLGYSTFDPGEGDYTVEDMDGDTALVTRAADLAAALGVVVVVSAGNEGNNPDWLRITAPADADSVIVAGAMRADSTRASFSSTGPTADGRTKPDVMALGVDIVYARPGDTYGHSGQGTSFAAPLVSGLVAQVLQANPALAPMEVRGIVRETASQSASPDNERGWGVANSAAAVERALFLADEPGPGPSTPSFHLYPTVMLRSHRALTVEMPGFGAEARATLRLFDVLGREVGVLYDGPARRGPFGVALPPLAAGVYLYRVEIGETAASGRIVVQ